MSSVLLPAKSTSGHVRAASLLIAGAVALACILLEASQTHAANSSADISTRISALNAEFDTELAGAILDGKALRVLEAPDFIPNCPSTESLDPVFANASASFKEKFAALPEATAKVDKEVVGIHFCVAEVFGKEDLWAALVAAASSRGPNDDAALIVGSGALGARDYAAARQYLQRHVTYLSKILDLDRDKERGDAEQVAKTEAKIDAARERIATIDAMEQAGISLFKVTPRSKQEDLAREIRQSFMGILETYAVQLRGMLTKGDKKLEKACKKVEEEGVFTNPDVDASTKLSAIEGAAKKVRERASKQGGAEAALQAVYLCRNVLSGAAFPGWGAAIYATAYYDMSEHKDGDLVAAYYGSGFLPATDLFRARKYLSGSSTRIDQDEKKLKAKLDDYVAMVIEQSAGFDEDPSTMTPAQ